MNTLPQQIWETSDDGKAFDASTQWTDGLVFEAFGETIGVRTNAPEVLERINEALPPVRTLSSDPRVENLYSLWVRPDQGKKAKPASSHALFRNNIKFYEGTDLEFVLRVLEDRISREVAYWADDDYIFVHAGVVGINGKAVVLPGRSGAGKSTLVAALLDAGADYYSDDMAIFDPGGKILPYPTPLATRSTGAVKEAVRISPDRTADKAIDMGLVLATRFDTGVARWQPRQLTPARAIMALFDHTVAARRLPKQAIQRFNRAIGGARAYRGRRGEAANIVDWIVRHVG